SLLCYCSRGLRPLPPFPTRRSSDLARLAAQQIDLAVAITVGTFDDHHPVQRRHRTRQGRDAHVAQPLLRSVFRAERHGVLQQHRSEEHTSELQSRENLVCRLLLEKK